MIEQLATSQPVGMLVVAILAGSVGYHVVNRSSGRWHPIFVALALTGAATVITVAVRVTTVSPNILMMSVATLSVGLAAFALLIGTVLTRRGTMALLKPVRDRRKVGRRA